MTSVPSIVSLYHTGTTASSTISSRSRRRHFPKENTNHHPHRTTSTNKHSPPSSATIPPMLTPSAAIYDKPSTTSPISTNHNHHVNHPITTTPGNYFHSTVNPPILDPITDGTTPTNTTYSTFSDKDVQRDPNSNENIPHNSKIPNAPQIVQIGTNSKLNPLLSKILPDNSMEYNLISAPITNGDQPPANNIVVCTSHPDICSESSIRATTPTSSSFDALCQEYNYEHGQH